MTLDRRKSSRKSVKRRFFPSPEREKTHVVERSRLPEEENCGLENSLPSSESNGPVYAFEKSPSKPPRSNARELLARHSFRSTEVYEMAFKIMLVGDSGVGKTCFLIRYKDRAFLTGAFISTVGIDFRNKIVNVDNRNIKLQIWDTAGQERFRSVTKAYYRDSHALFLLYDVGNKDSFDNTRSWLSEVRQHAQDDVLIMLIGNKADSSDREVSHEDGERLAEEYGAPFMETSAKTGMNVDLAFVAIARELKSRFSNQPKEPKFNVTAYIQQESEKPASTCCG